MLTDGTTFAGEHVDQGDPLRLLFGAANPRSQCFDDPDRFDITRSATSISPSALVTIAASAVRWHGRRSRSLFVPSCVDSPTCG
jgi:cytochrome P450